MWESRSDFQGGGETRRVSPPPSFPPPLLPRASFFFEARRPQLLKEFALGLLHTLGGFGIADRRGDALRGELRRTCPLPISCCRELHFFSKPAGRNCSKSLRLACCIRWAASVSLTAAAMRCKTAMVPGAGPPL